MTIWTQADVDRLTKSDRTKSVQNTKPGLFALGRMKAGKMNKTEAAYAGYLETLKIAGVVAWYGFDLINLRLGENCHYRPDFLVMTKERQLECHEVKGGYVTDDGLVKLKAAAEKFPFRFIMVKLVKGTWEVRNF